MPEDSVLAMNNVTFFVGGANSYLQDEVLILQEST